MAALTVRSLLGGISSERRASKRKRSVFFHVGVAGKLGFEKIEAVHDMSHSVAGLMSIPPGTSPAGPG